MKFVSVDADFHHAAVHHLFQLRPSQVVGSPDFPDDLKDDAVKTVALQEGIGIAVNAIVAVVKGQDDSGSVRTPLALQKAPQFVQCQRLKTVLRKPTKMGFKSGGVNGHLVGRGRSNIVIAQNRHTVTEGAAPPNS